MKKLSFKEKLEIVRNIIRESLSGNAAFALLVYSGNDSNLLIVFYVQIMPDDFVMQLHRF